MNEYNPPTNIDIIQNIGIEIMRKLLRAICSSTPVNDRLLRSIFQPDEPQNVQNIKHFRHML